MSARHGSGCFAFRGDDSPQCTCGLAALEADARRWRVIEKAVAGEIEALQWNYLGDMVDGKNWHLTIYATRKKLNGEPWECWEEWQIHNIPAATLAAAVDALAEAQEGK